MSKNDANAQPNSSLGSLIKNLRQERRLTGAQLGHLVGVSQSKISKIEKDYPPLPDNETTSRILDILEAPKYIRQQAALFLSRQGNFAGVPSVYDFHYSAKDFISLERASKSIKVIMINALPALLQTTAYRKAYGQRMGLSVGLLRTVMQETQMRQDLLWDESKNWSFILMETALYTLASTPAVQVAQLDRLERLANNGNIEVGIIPTEAGISLFELSNIVIYDDKTLLQGIGTHELTTRDEEELLNFTSLHTELRGKAHFDEEALKLIHKAADHFAGKKKHN